MRIALAALAARQAARRRGLMHKGSGTPLRLQKVVGRGEPEAVIRGLVQTLDAGNAKLGSRFLERSQK